MLDPMKELGLLEHWTAHQKVAGLIPGKDTYLGCRFNPQSGHVREATDQCFFLTSIFSLSQISKYILT